MQKQIRKQRKSKLLALLMLLSLTFFAAGCSSSSYTSTDKSHYIIEAKSAIKMLGEKNVILVDAQTPDGYSKEHIKGAINIDKDEVNIKVPVAGILGPKDLFEKVMSAKGISNDSTVIIYDNQNNSHSSRLLWAMKAYGHENLKVVSGGIEALKKAGAEASTEVPSVTATNYKAKDLNNEMIVTKDEVKAQVQNPDKNTILLDVRTQQEYDEGTIPGSILLNYEDNNYSDKTFKSSQDIKIMYLENNIKPDNKIILFCKTSTRAAETYLALYEAGYKNIRIYDGAWLEWDADKSLPIQVKDDGNKDTAAPQGNQDNS